MISYLANGGFIGRTANYRDTEQYAQYVGGLTSSSAGAVAGTRSIALSGISMLEGDMVIVAYERTGTATKTGTTISGYTTIAALYANNATPTTGVDSNLIVAYKFMGATPDANLVIPTSGATTDAEAVVVQVWRGINSSNPLDVSATTVTQITTGIPNPPAITPDTGAIIVVAAGTGHNGGTDTFTAAYLTNFLTVGGNSTTDATVGMGWLLGPGGAYDPAAWTFSQGDSTAYASNSVTFVLRSNAKNSGIWSLPAVLNPKLLDVVGQQEYLAASGTFSFVVPENLYEISAAVVGGGGGGAGGETGRDDGVTGGAGGGLAYGTFSVIPGETLTVVVGAGGNGGGSGSNGGAGGNSSIARGATVLLQGGGGQGGQERSTATRAGGTSTGTARAGGGAGGTSGGTTNTGGGGGGAGGYSGNGGNGGTSGAGTNGAGGGGGGGGATDAGQGYGGGGVALAGVTTSGTGGALNAIGTGGSGGANGTRPAGGLYGGGGGACDDDTNGSGGAGGRGAVRLVWGKDYSFSNNAPTGIVAIVAQRGIAFLPHIDQY